MAEKVTIGIFKCRKCSEPSIGIGDETVDAAQPPACDKCGGLDFEFIGKSRALIMEQKELSTVLPHLGQMAPILKGRPLS